MTFEETMNQIEEIIEKMESGELPLEDSIDAYEKGMKLIREAKKTLDSYEKKIEKISEEGKE